MLNVGAKPISVSGWADELWRRLFPPRWLWMLEDIDKALPVDSGVRLKVSLQLPVPACDASAFSCPIEQQGAAVLLDQPPLSLTEVSAETGLDFGIHS